MIPTADLLATSVDTGRGPLVRLTRADGDIQDLTLDEAWQRVEDYSGADTKGFGCHCEGCVLYAVIRHLR